LGGAVRGLVSPLALPFSHRRATDRPTPRPHPPRGGAAKTATLTFAPAGDHGGPPPPPFVATELARERIAAHTCDGRRGRAALAAEWPRVDFDGLASDADAMWGVAAAQEDAPSEMASTACAARAAALLRWLRARPERRIAVVTHWVFLTHLFALFPEHGPALGARFGNAEARAVTLARDANRTAAAAC